jgi:hypothetical protein
MRGIEVLGLRWLRTALAGPTWQIPRTVAQWARTGPRRMAALWRVASPDRIDLRLRRVQVPVTVVRGAGGRLCPAAGMWPIQRPQAAFRVAFRLALPASLLALARTFAAFRVRAGSRSTVPRTSRPRPIPSSQLSLAIARPS